MKFKQGDRIVNIGCRCGKGDRHRAMSNTNTGKHGRVDWVETDAYDGRYWHIKYDDGETGVGWDCCYELENKKTVMQKVSIMMKKLLSADVQTLVKAGYINGDLDLTAKGQAALMAQLFEANRAELVKAAEAELAEDKEQG